MNRRRLAAQFAAQKIPAGKASNLYYEGRVCYSYGPHFPIAVIDGSTAYFNSDKYSKSTSIQQGAVRYELSVHGYRIELCDTSEMKARAAAAQ